MVNANDPTRRRQLRVMKLKASRLKLQFDPNKAEGLLNLGSSSSLGPSLSSISPTSSFQSQSMTSLSPVPQFLTTSEQKKHARQIRNREAAIISRQRYLADAELVKQKVIKLEDENKMLREYIAKLHSEYPSLPIPLPISIPIPMNNFDMKYFKSDNYCTKEPAMFY